MLLGNVLGLQFSKLPYARQNMLTAEQSAFETWVSGWSGANSAAVSQDVTESRSGDASMKVITPGVRDLEGAVTDNISVEGSATYKASAWVKGTAGHQIRIEISNNIDRNAFNTHELTSEWTRIEVQFTTISETALVMIIGTVGTTEAIMNIDDCRFERVA